jgi:hypothetical protein
MDNEDLDNLGFAKSHELPWQAFEREVFEYVKQKYDSDTLGLRRE